MNDVAGSAAEASRLRSRLAVALAALLFSTGGACIKLLAGLTPWQRAGWRSAIAAGFLLVAWPPARRGWSVRSWAFGAFYAATLTTFVIANSWTTSANAIFLQSTAPLWVLLLSPFVLKEKVRRGDLYFMAALAGGLALCFVGERHAAAQSTAPFPMRGNLFAVASGVLWACTIVGLRWFGKRAASGDPSERDGAGASVIAGNVLCVAACWLLGLARGESFLAGATGLGAGELGALAFLGVVQVGLAYVFITRGMRRVPAMEASLLLLVEPVFNPIWTFLIHHETPSSWALGGGAVILGATAVHSLLARGKMAA